MKLWILLLVVVLSSEAAAQPEPVGRLFGPVPVIEVIDGDTVVLLSDLGPRTVRLIGIDTPEVAHPDRGREPFGVEASAYTSGLLPPGTAVWVELDLGFEDDYGRLLAYLYIEDPNGPWKIDGRPVTPVNLRIAEAGFARPLTVAPNTLYADLIEIAGAEARADRRGMWGGDQPMGAAADATATDGASAAATVRGDVVIACALVNPDTPNDEDGEWVSVSVRVAVDLRGYYLWDEGSGTAFALPLGVATPGVVVVRNPGQGVWNNGGDTIYLMRAGEVIDQWAYGRDQAVEGVETCR